MSLPVHGYSTEATPNLQLCAYSRRSFFQHLKTITSLADLAMAVEDIYDLTCSDVRSDSTTMPFVDIINFNTKYNVVIGDDLLSIELSGSDTGNKVNFALRDKDGIEYKVIDKLEITNLSPRGHIKLVNALHIIADWHLRPKKL